MKCNKCGDEPNSLANGMCDPCYHADRATRELRVQISARNYIHAAFEELHIADKEDLERAKKLITDIHARLPNDVRLKITLEAITHMGANL